MNARQDGYAAKVGTEAARHDFALGGRSATWGNRAYDAAYDREWSRLEGVASMVRTLEAIEAFWSEGDAPLSPYALITDDDDRSISQVVTVALNMYRDATQARPVHDATAEECSRG